MKIGIQIHCVTNNFNASMYYANMVGESDRIFPAYELLICYCQKMGEISSVSSTCAKECCSFFCIRRGCFGVWRTGRSIPTETPRNGEMKKKKKPRFLCLHGFRTSGEIMKKQIGKWPESVLERFDLVFIDAPFPSEGKSDVEGIFPPPYYEWFQFNPEFAEYRNFDECLNYIEDIMIKHGPFDGLMGFSQGAILSAALTGLQEKGLALTKVPKIKFLIIIAGAKFRSSALSEKAYSSRIQIPSLHFLGEMDFLKPYGTTLLESFVEPSVIHHPKGHTVPRLIDEKSLETMFNFIEKIEKILSFNSSLMLETTEEHLD